MIMRTLLSALSVLALFAGTASAQVTTCLGSTHKLTVVLSGAKTSADATVNATWTGNGGPKTESTTTNGTTEVTVVAGVDGDPPRTVNSLVVSNTDTGAITITVRKKVGSTNYPLINALTMQVGDTLVYDYTGTFRLIDSSGQHKTASTPNLSNLTIGASTAGAGTTTTDAGVLPAGTANVYPTTGANGTVGVRVHASDKVTGRTIYIGNGVSNAILKVYAPSGGTINGAAADAAFSSVSGKGVIMTCLSSSGNTWLAW